MKFQNFVQDIDVFARDIRHICLLLWNVEKLTAKVAVYRKDPEISMKEKKKSRIRKKTLRR